MSDLVRFEGVRVTRGGFTLDVPAWSVPAGSVVGLVGANGAGKSTLLELLPGFRRADAGRVRVLGLDPVEDVVGVRSQLGFMSDDMPVFALRVGALLRFVSGYYATWDAALVDQLVARFGLDLQSHVSLLSKGQATRVRLVLALAHRPRVVVLDEPGTGLDVGGRRALLQTVLEVVKDPARAVIVSSHQLEDLERIADRITLLRQGRIVADGPTPDVVGDGRTLEELALAAEVVS